MQKFFVKIKNWLWFVVKVRRNLNTKVIKSKNKSTQDLVLVHGIASNLRVWSKVVSELKSDYRIVLVDLLGFGGSPKPDNIEYNANQHSYMLYRALKKARVKKNAIVVGHSMGSIIALNYVSTYTNRVSRLVLCSLPIYKRSELTDKKLFAWQRETDNLYFRLYRILRSKKDFSIKTAQMLRKMGLKQIELSHQSWPAFKNSLHNTIEHQNVEKDIKNIKVPIDIIYGKFDFLLISKHLRDLTKYKNVREFQVNARHDINKKFAKDIAKLIDDSDI